MKKSVYTVVGASLCSLFIYLFYRTNKTVVNELAIQLLSLENYATLKAFVIQSLPLPDWMIYSLPEGLWVFCVTYTSIPFYIQQKNWRLNCSVVPLIYCISLEVFQLFHLINGRFDYMDILLSVLFWLLAIFAFKDKLNKQNMLTPLNSNKLFCLFTYGIVYLSHVLK